MNIVSYVPFTLMNYDLFRFSMLIRASLIRQHITLLEIDSDEHVEVPLLQRLPLREDTASE